MSPDLADDVDALPPQPGSAGRCGTTRLSHTVGGGLHICDDIVLQLPARHYPVIVTTTQTHVLWVAAGSQADAVDTLRYYDLDQLDEETCVADNVEIEAPGPWSWSTVTRTSSHGYPGTPYDAHIQTHQSLLRHRERLAVQATCAANGHPDRSQWAGMVTCNLCQAFVEQVSDRG